MALDVYTLVGSLGFPIAVSVYLIVENRNTAKSLDKNTEALNELKTVIAIHTETSKNKGT